MRSRIMYIESKPLALTGPARIGRVTEDWRDALLQRPRPDGEDALYKSNVRAAIDEDVREEYWTTIRRKPENIARSET